MNIVGMMLTAVYNSKQAQTLQSFFETTLNLKENNFNFGTTNYLKSRAMRLLAKRYAPLLTYQQPTRMFLPLRGAKQPDSNCTRIRKLAQSLLTEELCRHHARFVDER